MKKTFCDNCGIEPGPDVVRIRLVAQPGDPYEMDECRLDLCRGCAGMPLALLNLEPVIKYMANIAEMAGRAHP
jgi:hypothetical protein